MYAAEDASGNVDLWLVDVEGRQPDPPDRRPGAGPQPGLVPGRQRDRVRVGAEAARRACGEIPRLGGQAPTLIVAGAGRPAISPDGTRIAFTRPDASGNRRIVVAPLADTGEARVITTERDGLWDHDWPSWSPDGRILCYSAQADLWKVAVGRWPAEPADVGGRGRLRAGVVVRWQVGLLLVDAGRHDRDLASPGRRRGARAGHDGQRARNVSPASRSDGTRLAYSTYRLNSNLVVRDEKTGKEYEFGGERRELCPALAPDGSARRVRVGPGEVAAGPLDPAARRGRLGGRAGQTADGPARAQRPTRATRPTADGSRTTGC